MRKIDFSGHKIDFTFGGEKKSCEKSPALNKGSGKE